MFMAKRRVKPWSNDRSWSPRGFACYDKEWAAYKASAALSGSKSVNGWIRLWLNEAVLFEVANSKDREDLSDAET